MIAKEGTVMKSRTIVGIAVVAAALAIAGYALADQETELKMQEAREALNQARYEYAAQMLAEIYEVEKGREAAGNALYWQAFARYKLQRTSELKVAAELLRLQQEEYANSETAPDGEALLARLYGELAQRGEAHAVREIHELSDDEMQREATRVAALEALMRMDPDKAMPILEKIVTGEKEVSEDMRRHSVFILCRMDDARSEDLLIDLMQKEENPEIDINKYKPNDELFQRVDDVVLKLRTKKIKENFSEDGTLRLKPVFEALGGEVSYDELRVCMLFLV